MHTRTLGFPIAAQPTLFRWLTGIAAILVAATLLWGLFDTRMIEDVPVWVKRFKFSLSFMVLFATLHLVEARLSRTVQTGRPMRIAGWVMAAGFLAEMGYIITQAAQAEASHFNHDTPFHAFMYSVIMATGAVALVASIGAIGWIVKRDQRADLSPALREAIWLGFVITFMLTLIVAGYMSSINTHGIGAGVPPEGRATLPFFGWSAVHGDLRPAHFASLHAMQALPLLAIWLDFTNRSSAKVFWVRGAAVVYVLLVLALFAQALLGLPLIPLS